MQVFLLQVCFAASVFCCKCFFAVGFFFASSVFLLQGFFLLQVFFYCKCFFCCKCFLLLQVFATEIALDGQTRVALRGCWCNVVFRAYCGAMWDALPTLFWHPMRCINLDIWILQVYRCVGFQFLMHLLSEKKITKRYISPKLHLRAKRSINSAKIQFLVPKFCGFKIQRNTQKFNWPHQNSITCSTDYTRVGFADWSEFLINRWMPVRFFGICTFVFVYLYLE